MKLSIHIQCGSLNDGFAAGMVIEQQPEQLALYEAGYFYSDGSEVLAGYRTLLRALELVAAMGADELALNVSSPDIVAHVTGTADADATAEELYQQTLMKLLQVPTWQMRQAAQVRSGRVADLLGEALTSQRDVTARPTQRPSERAAQSQGASEAASDTGSCAAIDDAAQSEEVCFTAQLQENPGPKCPAGYLEGQLFYFSSETPHGMCLDAAVTAIENGPRCWSADQQNATVKCRRCQTPILLQRQQS